MEVIHCYLAKMVINFATYSPKRPHVVVNMTNPALDETDRRIIAVLSDEGRYSRTWTLRIASVYLPTPCSRRVKRLEEAGVIMGYGARVNQAAIGQSVSVMVQVRLSQQSPADIAVHSCLQCTVSQRSPSAFW